MLPDERDMPLRHSGVTGRAPLGTAASSSEFGDDREAHRLAAVHRLQPLLGITPRQALSHDARRLQNTVRHEDEQAG